MTSTDELLQDSSDQLYESILIKKNFTKARLEEDVERLRHWVEKQPHLPHNLEDEVLKTFIWGTKTMAKAQKKLDKYFWCKATMKEVFENRDPADAKLLRGNQTMLCFFLPQLTPDGYRICLITAKEGGDPDGFDYMESLRRRTMMWDIILLTGSMAKQQSNIYLIDFAHVTANLMLKILPSTIKKDSEYCLTALPTPVKSVIMFNINPVVEKIFNYMYKPIIPKKSFAKLQFTSKDHTCLKDMFPLDILPKDYKGGKELSCQELNDKWTELLIMWRPWLLGDGGTRCSNEKLRPPDNENRPDQDSVQGTFRNLEID